MQKSVSPIGRIILVALIAAAAFWIVYLNKPNTFFSLQSNSAYEEYIPQTSSTYAFSVVDEQGKPQKDFAITHTKTMHVIVVRKDLSSFQHLHPDYDPTTGLFMLSDVVFPTEGVYRVFADFTVGTRPFTLSEDLQVGDGGNDEPLAATDERTKVLGDKKVTLTTQGALMADKEQTLVFTLSRDDVPITDLEPYLGARGHTVILKEGTLDFIHTHPVEKETQDGNVAFMVQFPEAGRYKLFTEFQHEGKVFLTDFVVSVTENGEAPAPMPAPDHSMP